MIDPGLSELLIGQYAQMMQRVNNWHPENPRKFILDSARFDRVMMGIFSGIMGIITCLLFAKGLTLKSIPFALSCFVYIVICVITLVLLKRNSFRLNIIIIPWYVFSLIVSLCPIITAAIINIQNLNAATIYGLLALPGIALIALLIAVLSRKDLHLACYAFAFPEKYESTEEIREHWEDYNYDPMEDPERRG
jgi:hypothetical protein